MLKQVGYFLGLGVSNAVCALNPDVIVIGGGMIKSGEIILEPLREEVRRRVFREHIQDLKILPAQLGNDAGMIGAAGLALQQTVPNH